jgi:thymidylate kinase
VTKTPYYFEFTGLPGAGKTTISKKVAQNLAGMNYKYFVNRSLSNTNNDEQKKIERVFSKIETFYYFISSCVNYKYVALNAFLCAIQTRPLSLESFWRAAKLLIRLNFIKSIMEENYDLILLDQGLIQNIWSISATGNQPPEKTIIELLKSILEEISLNIVLVDIDVDIAIDRITKRPTMASRFDKMSLLMVEKMLTKQQDFFKQVVIWCEDLKVIRCLAVDGNHPIENNSNIIINFILQTWQTV